MRVEPSKANAVSYYEIDITNTVAQALKNKLIIEYPTLLVMSAEEASSYKIVPSPTMVPNARAEDVAKDLGVEVAYAEELPYARKRKLNEDDGWGKGRGRGRGGERVQGRGRGQERGRANAGRGEDGSAEGGGEGGEMEKGGGGSDDEDADTDLADPDLLRAIEGAQSREDLKRVQEELDQQLGIKNPEGMGGGQKDEESGLTPGVCDMKLGQEKHL